MKYIYRSYHPGGERTDPMPSISAAIEQAAYDLKREAAEPAGVYSNHADTILLISKEDLILLARGLNKVRPPLSQKTREAAKGLRLMAETMVAMAKTLEEGETEVVSNDLDLTCGPWSAFDVVDTLTASGGISAAPYLANPPSSARHLTLSGTLKVR